MSLAGKLPSTLRLLSLRIGRDPAGITADLDAHAEAWERDLADVERFRALARGNGDERDRLRVLLRAVAGVSPRDIATGGVFTHSLGGPVSHRFRFEYANTALCGFYPRGPYQPMSGLPTCPDCVDVAAAIDAVDPAGGKS